MQNDDKQRSVNTATMEDLFSNKFFLSLTKIEPSQSMHKQVEEEMARYTNESPLPNKQLSMRMVEKQSTNVPNSGKGNQVRLFFVFFCLSTAGDTLSAQC